MRCTHTQKEPVVSVATLAACSAGALAQIQPVVVSAPFRVSPFGEHWRECSIGVNQGPTLADRNDLLVMATGPSKLRYVAFDWDPTQPAPGAQSVQDCSGGDVWVTPHPDDGSVWFTALQGANSGGDGGGGEDGGTPWPPAAPCGGLIYGWKNAHSSSLASVLKLSGESLQDKPSLAIWVDDEDPPESHWYLIRQRKIDNCNKDQYDIDVSTDAPANNWDNHTVAPTGTYSGCHYEGWGALSVILDTGRIVTVSRDEDPESGGQYYDNIPYVIYSDATDHGVWFPGPDVNQEIHPVRLGHSQNGQVYASTTKGSVNDPGDTPFNVDRRNHAPSIAVERIAGADDRVYVAFCARSAQGSSNTDIYIARSLNSETSISFPGPGSLEFLHITDAMLGLTGAQADADQFVPAIALDACGGINLMFYDNRSDPDGFDGEPGVQEDWVDVYYARITGFGTPNPQIQQWRLTPNAVRTDNLGQGGAPVFLGDYHNLTVAGNGRVMYAAYIARDVAAPETGTVSCYVHRINHACAGAMSEFNGDGVVSPADADAYLNAWGMNDPNADTNLDASVDGADLIDYVITYSQEGGGE